MPPANPSRTRRELPSWLLPTTGTAALVVSLVALASGPLAIRLVGLALVFASAGFFCEALVVRLRGRGEHWVAPMRPMVYARLPNQPVLAAVVVAARAVRARIDAIDWVGDWAPGIIAALTNLLIIDGVIGFLRSPGWLQVGPAMWAAVVLLAGAIPGLLGQRLTSSLRPNEGPGVDLLVRVPLFALLVGGVATLLAAQGYLWANWALYVVGGVIGLSSAEVVCRAAAQVFIPLGPARERRNPALPWLPSLLRLGLPRPARAGAWLREAYGIDLAGSWVFTFLARAILPVLLFVALLAWLSTAVTVLGVSERAVVERLGKPVGVVGPGMHLHLPWPLGRARVVELGVVHQLPIVFSGKPGGRLLAELASAGAADAEASMGAEAIPGRTADRLWDESHPGEASYLIASRNGGREGFQIVNVDLRIVFRVSDDDDGAMASVYGATDPATLIRATAGRLLVSHFSSSTLDELLGENRAGFVDRFRADLQARVAAFHAGIAVINVVVEAIHPPGGAASAYHNVQAAAVRSDAMRFQNQARAFALRGSAGRDGDLAVDQAKAAASEKLGAAQATLATFQASTKSLRAGPDVFLFESWLSHLGDALNRAHLIVIDHRLDAEKSTLDLRPVAAGYGSTP